MSAIKARIILELMGRPPEHIKEALTTLVVRMGAESSISLLDVKYHDPRPVKDKDNLFTTFAEVDAEFESLGQLFSIVMGYLPSNVEVYEPQKITFNLTDLNPLVNYLISKLHRYDEIAKRALGERNILLQQLQHLQKGGTLEGFMQARPNIVKEKSASSDKKRPAARKKPSQKKVSTRKPAKKDHRAKRAASTRKKR